MKTELKDITDSCIYAIWADGRPDKCYIGKTVNYSVRAKRHLTDLKAKRHGNSHLQRLYDKNIQLTIVPIEICQKENLSVREQFWVSFFNSNKNGYNMSKGGESLPDSILVWSDERRKQWSKYCSDNPIAKGSKKSESWHTKMQDSIQRRKAAGVFVQHLNKKCTVQDELGNKSEYRNIKEASKATSVAYTYLTEKMKKGSGTARIKNLTFTTNE